MKFLSGVMVLGAIAIGLARCAILFANGVQNSSDILVIMLTLVFSAIILNGLGGNGKDSSDKPTVP